MRRLTCEYIDANRTNNGAWTRRQLAAIGVAWPPVRGWKDRVVGTTISDKSAEEFESGRGMERGTTPAGAARINLNCPYAEKDLAKSLGARCDFVNKVWYIVDVEDLTPFMRWIGKPEKRTDPRNHPAHESLPKENHRSGTVTKSIYVPHCGCYHVLPWEDCEHTIAIA